MLHGNSADQVMPMYSSKSSGELMESNKSRSVSKTRLKISLWGTYKKFTQKIPRLQVISKVQSPSIFSIPSKICLTDLKDTTCLSRVLLHNSARFFQKTTDQRRTLLDYFWNTCPTIAICKSVNISSVSRISVGALNYIFVYATRPNWESLDTLVDVHAKFSAHKSTPGCILH